MKKPKVLIIIICTFTNLLPARSFAEEYYFECRKGSYSSVLTINTRTNVVKEHMNYGTILISNLILSSPKTFVWKKENRLGPYPNYLYPNKIVDTKSVFIKELNRETFQMNVIRKDYDYGENKYTETTKDFQCIEGK
jgi:hypothetical protein